MCADKLSLLEIEIVTIRGLAQESMMLSDARVYPYLCHRNDAPAHAAPAETKGPHQIILALQSTMHPGQSHEKSDRQDRQTDRQIDRQTDSFVCTHQHQHNAPKLKLKSS